jgi:GTP-binding protein Era
METVDYSLLVVDAARTMTPSYRDSLMSLMVHALDSDGRVEAVLDETYEADKPQECFGIVLNKVDLVNPKDQLLEIADDLGTMAEQCIAYYAEHNKDANVTSLEDMFPHMFYTNALAGEGTDDVVNHLIHLATPCQVWAVEAGQPTMMSPLERIEEIIREKIYRCLHKEVPHAVKQVNRLFVRRGTGIVEIQQDLVVKSKSHHSIIAGRNLATIQQTAQQELEKALFPEMKVILHLHLKLNKSQHDRYSRADMQGTIEFRPRP